MPGIMYMVQNFHMWILCRPNLLRQSPDRDPEHFVELAIMQIKHSCSMVNNNNTISLYYMELGNRLAMFIVTEEYLLEWLWHYVLTLFCCGYHPINLCFSQLTSKVERRTLLLVRHSQWLAPPKR